MLRRCRVLYNTALEQRITAWAALPRLRHALPAGSGAEGDPRGRSRSTPPSTATCCKTCWPGWTRPIRRSFAAWRQASGRGFPASRGALAGTPSPTRSTATALAWTTAVWCCRRLAASPCAGPARLRGPSRRSPSRARPTAGTSAARVPRCLSQPLPLTGQETGIDVGLQVFLTTADGQIVENPRHHRKAERALKKAQQRVSRRRKGSHRRKKAAQQCAKQHQHVRRQRSDFHHKTALALVRGTTRSITRPSRSPT